MVVAEVEKELVCGVYTEGEEAVFIIQAVCEVQAEAEKLVEQQAYNLV
jgi:hypothetical protein